MRVHKLLSRTAYLLVAVVAIISVLTFTGIGCPIWYLFMIPCPTCGVTRALRALFYLDIKGYLAYNAMALPLGVAVWLLLCADLFGKKRGICWFAYGILIVNTIYYIVRIWIYGGTI